MIAFFSILLGFLGSTFPEVLKLLREGKDRAHELSLLQLQIDYEREKLATRQHTGELLHQQKLQEIMVAERQALNAGAGTREGALGIGWVDALAGSVRPVMTYSFFVLYALVKYCQYQLLTAPSLPWQPPLDGAQAMLALWTEEDMGIFAAVIAFWFGSRAIGKLRRA